MVDFRYLALSIVFCSGLVSHWDACGYVLVSVGFVKYLTAAVNRYTQSYESPEGTWGF